jgi:Uma2 family endonuclease
MTAQPQQYITEEEYIRLERASIIKHEYYQGRIYAMTGAKVAHNVISGNILASLHQQLRHKDCQVMSSDMRIKVQETGLNTYPDVVVICGQPQFTDDTTDTLLNPIVIVEVLSPSTELYDRGLKFQNYRTIVSLQAYILVAQDNVHVEYFSRQETDLWTFQEATNREAIVHIASIGCDLLPSDVYEKVDLKPENTSLPRDIPSEE